MTELKFKWSVKLNKRQFDRMWASIISGTYDHAMRLAVNGLAPWPVVPASARPVSVGALMHPERRP